MLWFFLCGMAPALFVYCNTCIVMVLWSGSVVSLLYEAIYSSVCLCKVGGEREAFGAVQLSAANCNCRVPNTFVCRVLVSHIQTGMQLQ